MKKVVVILITMLATMTNAQTTELKPIPLINVSGEGKIKVTPDQASISISVAVPSQPSPGADRARVYGMIRLPF